MQSKASGACNSAGVDAAPARNGRSMSAAALAPSTGGGRGVTDKGGAPDIDIGDFLGALRARWRLLPLCLGATLAVAGAYVLLAPKRYGAAMSFMVDTRARPPVGSDVTPPPQSADVALVENQMRLLQSSKVLMRVAEDERLGEDPDFAAGGLLSRLFGGKSGGSAQIAETLARAVTVKRAEKSHVMDVEILASAPDKAERLAGALAKAYLGASAELHEAMEDKEAKWLDEQIGALRRRVEAAEARVENYRAANALVGADGKTPPEKQLEEASAALVIARGKRAEAEAAYRQFLAGARDGTSETTRTQLMDRLRDEYARLARDAAQQQTTLGPRHPAYIALQNQLAAQRAQIERESRNIRDILQRALAGAGDVERQAEEHVARLKKTITDSGAQRIELHELEDRADSLRETYQKALAARASTRREVVASPSAVLINQPRALEGRVSPRTTPSLIIALAAGVNLWIVAALLSEYFARRATRDDSVAAAEPIRAIPDVAAPREDHAPEPPFHGTRFLIPDFGAPTSGGDGTILRALGAMEPRASAYRRAVEDIYLAIRKLSERVPFVVTIGGPVPGSGATTVTLSLALVACRMGERVLIVDADGDSAAFADLRAHLVPAALPGGADGRVFACQHDAESGGSLYLALDCGMRSPAEIFARFDLIVVDRGAGRARPGDESAGAVVTVARAGDRRRRATLVDATKDKATGDARAAAPLAWASA